MDGPVQRRARDLMATRVSFADKRVLISGGASGFGAALAKEIISTGGHVRVLDLDTSPIDPLIKTTLCDMRDADAVFLAVQSFESEFGSPDIAICNAATDMTAEAHEFAPEDWSRILDTNLKGAANLIAATYPDMVDRGAGHIVIISSGAGRLGFPMGLPYATSKAGLNGLARTLRAEARPMGVAVSLVTLPLLQGGLATKSLAGPGVDRQAYLRSVPGTTYPVGEIARKAAIGLAKQSANVVLPRHMGFVYWAIDVFPFIGTIIRRRLVANYHAIKTH